MRNSFLVFLALLWTVSAQAGQLVEVEIEHHWSVLGVMTAGAVPQTHGTSTAQMGTWGGGPALTGTATVAPPTTSPISSITVQFSNHSALSVTAGGALTGGVQSVHVCAYLFGFCAIAIPVATGAAGTATTGHYGIHVTVINQKWTLGQAIATGLTSGGLPLPNVTITGSFDLATGATGHGFLSLVAATTIVVSAPSFNVRSRTATPSRLHLRFVPEPSSTWLLGAAVLGITSVARKRRLAPGRMESRSAPDSCGV